MPPAPHGKTASLRTRRRLLYLLSWIALSAGAYAQETRRAVPGSCLQVMEGVSRTFVALERARQESRSADLVAGARQLVAQAGQIPALDAARAAEDRDSYLAARSRLAAMAEELAGFAKERDARTEAIALQRVRLSCISCHVRFRVGGGDAFPALRNTIWGRVKVETMDAEAREDCSDVVLFLDSVDDRTSLPAPAVHPSMSQKGQEFLPPVLPVVRDTEVRFPNDDSVFHNVFSLSKPKPFDLGIYGQGTMEARVFPDTGLVRVFCNIHPQMNASILILDNPWFAVTDPRGVFVITDVPDGTYSLRAWQELGGGDAQTVTVTGGVVQQANRTIRETSRIVQQHKNKFGQPYRRQVPLMRMTLRSRIFRGMGLLAMGFIVAALLGFTVLMNGIVDRAASERLVEASTSLARYLELRLHLLEVIAASLAESPYLKATLRIERVDGPTVLRAAKDALEVTELDFVVLTDARGLVLADTEGLEAFGSRPEAGLDLGRVLAGERVSCLWEGSDRLALVGAAPIVTGKQVIGIVFAGRRVDRGLAHDIHEAVGTEVLVLRRHEVVAEFGLPTGFLAGSPDLARELEDAGSEPLRARGGGDRLLAASRLGQETKMVLARSTEDLRARFRKLWLWVLACGVLSAGAAMALSRVLSRKLARPLQMLAEAAAQVARGNLNVTIAAGTATEEIAQLEAAFNHMTQQVQHLVDDVRAKADVLQQQKEELQWSNQVKSDFLVTASHELRTPVTNIRSSVELLSEHGADKEESTRHEFLGVLMSETERLMRLLDQIMELAGFEAGTIRCGRSALDLGNLLDNALEKFPAVDRERVRVTRAPQNLFEGDAPRISRVLTELLDNAFKFSPAGSEVEVELAPVGDGYEVAIADRGPGLPSPKDKLHVFESFVQGGDLMTGKPKGAGLGLPLCRAIVAAHGGWIRCDDRPGGGTVFRVFLGARVAAGTEPAGATGPAAAREVRVTAPAPALQP